MVTNWFACALHCQMESTGLLRKGTADRAGPPGSSHAKGDVGQAEGDVCGWMTDGGLSVPDGQIALPAPLVALVPAAVPFCDSSLAILIHEQVVPGRWSLAPPETRSSIHFVDRTALPARAPSAVS